MIPADAATMAEDHTAAIERQIYIYTHAPRDVAWIPEMRHVVEVSRRIIRRGELACELVGPDTVARAVELGTLRDDEIEVFKDWSRHALVGLQFTAQDAGALKLWKRHRTAYSIDPELWAELGDADDDTTIPPGLLSKLPHPNPFIALPEPILVPTFDRGPTETFQRIEGFYVTGRVQVGGGYLATSSEHAHGSLSLLICSKIVRANGSHYRNPEGMPDYAWTRIGVDEGYTVGEMADATRATFTMAAASLDWQSEIVTSLRRCVAILLYLCATNADLQPLPVPPVKHGQRGKTSGRKPVRVVKVGYRLGAELRAHHAAVREARIAEPTGRRVAPHVRRAHFHTFRVGPGRVNERTQTEIKWVSAIPINFDKPADKTTVHRARKGKDREQVASSAVRVSPEHREEQGPPAGVPAL